MKLTLRGAKRKADKLWSLKIREKKYCEVCGRTGNQPHHLIGRKNYALRWDLRNGVLLCYTHHVGGKQSAHNDPVWFLNWFKKNRPEDWKHILAERNKIVKRKLEDYLDLIKCLEGK